MTTAVRRLAFDRTLPAACEALRPCRLRGNDNRKGRTVRSGCDTFQTVPRHRPRGGRHLKPIITPPTPSHTWAELLRLVGAARRPGVDRSLDDADRSRRFRDAFCEYDGEFDDGK